MSMITTYSFITFKYGPFQYSSFLPSQTSLGWSYEFSSLLLWHYEVLFWAA